MGGSGGGEVVVAVGPGHPVGIAAFVLVGFLILGSAPFRPLLVIVVVRIGVTAADGGCRRAAAVVQAVEDGVQQGAAGGPRPEDFHDRGLAVRQLGGEPVDVREIGHVLQDGPAHLIRHDQARGIDVGGKVPLGRLKAAVQVVAPQGEEEPAP